MADQLHPLTHVIETAFGSLRQQPQNFPAVIEWACPVPFFGHAERARIASVGLNPSDREFRDRSGRPLRGAKRRLETRESLGLRDWSVAGPAECSAVAEACSGYFDGCPYGWFDALEAIFESAGRGTLHDGGACHIDLAPWATQRTWSRLGPGERDALLERGAETLAALLSSVQLEVLLLNGKAVVEGFERATGVRLPVEYATEWDDRGRRGRRWSLVVDSLGSIELARPVTILGWNWNLQSSHITTPTRDSITTSAARAIEQSVTGTLSHDTDLVVDRDDRRDRELQDASWAVMQHFKEATGSLVQAVDRLETLEPTSEERRGMARVLEGHFNRVKFKAAQLDEILRPRRSGPR